MMTDEMLTQAAGELAYAMNKSLPESGACSHQFSAGFERKMKRLMRRTDHPGMYRVLRAVAGMILVISIGFGSLLALSPEARAAVYGWVRRQCESFFEYQFEGESKLPGKLGIAPNGFQRGMNWTLPRKLQAARHISTTTKMDCLCCSAI